MREKTQGNKRLLDDATRTPDPSPQCNTTPLCREEKKAFERVSQTEVGLLKFEKLCVNTCFW